MAENSRPPVAIRIVRPYDTEDELLENELETIGKTSVVLIGAHPRPTGVILRFEVTLASGPTVLRGEGRVLSHKDNAFRGQAGLTLRFTRLDPKSKAIVDRATAMRETRAAAPPHLGPESPIAVALSAATPPPGPAVSVADQEAAVANARAAAREKANANARANAKRTGRAAQALTPPPADAADAEPRSHAAQRTEEAEASRGGATPNPESEPVTSIPGEVAEKPGGPISRRTTTLGGGFARPNTTQSGQSDAAKVEARPEAVRPPQGGVPPTDRDELLARLRERASKLPRERVAEILAARPRR